MAHLETVRRHLERAAHLHRQAHLDALREAAIARAEQDAHNPPDAPQTGLQAPVDGFWALGEED